MRPPGFYFDIGSDAALQRTSTKHENRQASTVLGCAAIKILHEEAKNSRSLKDFGVR
jgi:hypothetical protein